MYEKKLEKIYDDLTDIYLDYRRGVIGISDIQNAVYVQTAINRIVWILNEQMNEDNE